MKLIAFYLIVAIIHAIATLAFHATRNQHAPVRFAMWIGGALLAGIWFPSLVRFTWLVMGFDPFPMPPFRNWMIGVLVSALVIRICVTRAGSRWRAWLRMPDLSMPEVDEQQPERQPQTKRQRGYSWSPRG